MVRQIQQVLRDMLTLRGNEQQNCPRCGTPNNGTCPNPACNK